MYALDEEEEKVEDSAICLLAGLMYIYAYIIIALALSVRPTPPATTTDPFTIYSQQSSPVTHAFTFSPSNKFRDPLFRFLFLAEAIL